MSVVSTAWRSLGNVFFKKAEVYTLGWQSLVQLKTHHVVGAQYGGPLATLKHEARFGQWQGASKPLVYIFSAAGTELSCIRLVQDKSIHDIFWSNSEDLLCMHCDGTVIVYDIFGNQKHTIIMGPEVVSEQVSDAVCFTNSNGGNGLAVLTSKNNFFVVVDIVEPLTRKLSQVPELFQAPSCWGVAIREQKPAILVAKENELYELTLHGKCNIFEPGDGFTETIGRYSKVAVSFNNKYIAIFADTSMLWIGHNDETFTTIRKCVVQSEYPPERLVWCATSAVACIWSDKLLLVGPSGDTIEYIVEPGVCLVEEIDGIRLVGDLTHEFISKVPEPIENIYKVGSVAASMMLHAAYEEFDKKEQKADDYLRAIKDTLDIAVKECTDAAACEWEPAAQKHLLRAASFGKAFLSKPDPTHFVKTCQMLRVLNAIRDTSIGIPLTFLQLENLTVDVLLDRLVHRRQYCLAHTICQYLKKPDSTNRVLEHWACYKVQQTNVDDECIAEEIASKLRNTSGVSYAQIAAKAVRAGKLQLATGLLNYEPRASKQVPLLMEMRKYQTALAKAIDSGDTDLIYMVVLKLQGEMSKSEFQRAATSVPISYALLIQYCKEKGIREPAFRALMLDLHDQMDNHLEIAHCKIQESNDSSLRVEERLVAAADAQERYGNARLDWAKRLAEEHHRLLKYQDNLEQKFVGSKYVGLSLRDTIYRLILHRQNKLAEQLKKEFKLPEGKFWWIKVEGLSELADWVELEKLGNSKKSPIGYTPFIDACLKYDNKFDAQKFLAKAFPAEKVYCLVKLDMLEEAANLAVQNKDAEEIDHVLSHLTPARAHLAGRLNNAKAHL